MGQSCGAMVNLCILLLFVGMSRASLRTESTGQDRRAPPAMAGAYYGRIGTTDASLAGPGEPEVTVAEPGRLASTRLAVTLGLVLLVLG